MVIVEKIYILGWKILLKIHIVTGTLRKVAFLFSSHGLLYFTAIIFFTELLKLSFLLIIKSRNNSFMEDWVSNCLDVLRFIHLSMFSSCSISRCTSSCPQGAPLRTLAFFCVSHVGPSQKMSLIQNFASISSIKNGHRHF